jgi:hypothetical protein
VSFDVARKQLKRIYRTSDEAPWGSMSAVYGSPPGSQLNIVIPAFDCDLGLLSRARPGDVRRRCARP